MAVDIGPKIGIDGEAEFRKQINLLTQQVKTFGTEMAVVAAEFEGNEKSAEALTAQNEVLNKSIEAQTQKLEKLKEGLAKAEEKYSATDAKTLRWQQAVNEASQSLKKMENQVAKNEAAITALNAEVDDAGDEFQEAAEDVPKLGDALKAHLKSILKFEKGIEDAGDAMEDAGEKTISLGDILKANLVSDAIIGGVKSIADSIKQMAEESREYRKIMGSLELSSEQAGYSAEETAESYRSLYGVLGDNQTAATTTANLQALELEQDKLTEILNGTVGAWAKYGDSIPIDGLAEAINETVKTGSVTGTFADVLNWAGSSEDDFNEKLSKAADSTERANMVLEELSRQGLVEAGKAWKENNKSLVEANEAAADYEAAQARLGETIEPILTSLQGGLTDILNISADILEGIDFEEIAAGIGKVSDFFTGLVEDVQSGEITSKEAFDTVLKAGENLLKDIIEEIKETLPEILKQGKALLGEFADGMMDAAPEVYETIESVLTESLDEFASSLPEMLEAGGELLLSVAEGILQSIPQVVSAAAETVGEFGGTILDHLPEILETGMKVLGELIAGLIRAIPELISEVAAIAVEIGKEFLDYDWGQLGGDILQGLANGISGFIGTVIDAAKDAARAISSAFKDFFDIHSPSVKMRDEVGKQITVGIAEGILAKKEYAKKSAEEVSSAILQAAQKKLSNYKVYNNLTLADEVAFWDEMRAKTTDGTQARIDADSQYFEAKKKLNEQLVANEESYKENITRIHEELNENIQNAWKSYYDQVDSLTDSIKSSMGLFDYFDMGTDLTSEDLIANLESQVEGLERWQESLDTLRDRGVSEELIKELEEMGVSAAGEVEILADMTNKELRKYVHLWEEKSELAREAAVEQLEPVLYETRKQIQELRKQAGEELTLYQQEYVAAMEELGVLVMEPLENLKINLVGQMTNIVTAIADTIEQQAASSENKGKYQAVPENILSSVSGLPESFKNIGTNTVAGIIDGMKGQIPELKQTMAEISNMLVWSAMDVLDIHSPSRVMRDKVGKNIMAGYAEGIEQYKGMVFQAVRNSSADISSMFNDDATVPKNAGMSDMFLDSMCQALASVQVVLEDGVLVGKLSPRIDKTLGGYTKTKERYYT